MYHGLQQGACLPPHLAYDRKSVRRKVLKWARPGRIPAIYRGRRYSRPWKDCLCCEPVRSCVKNVCAPLNAFRPRWSAIGVECTAGRTIRRQSTTVLWLLVQSHSKINPSEDARTDTAGWRRQPRHGTQHRTLSLGRITTSYRRSARRRSAIRTRCNTGDTSMPIYPIQTPHVIRQPIASCTLLQAQAATPLIDLDYYCRSSSKSSSHPLSAQRT